MARFLTGVWTFQVRRPTNASLRGFVFCRGAWLARQKQWWFPPLLFSFFFFSLIHHLFVVSPLFSPLSSATPSGTGHAWRSCRNSLCGLAAQRVFLRLCHCETVTDVTVVAIRVPRLRVKENGLPRRCAHRLAMTRVEHFLQNITKRPIAYCGGLC